MASIQLAQILGTVAPTTSSTRVTTLRKLDDAHNYRTTSTNSASKQHIDAWHAQCLEQRHELEVLDLYRLVKRTGDGQPFARSGTVGI